MKRFVKLAALLFLVFGVGGFGVWSYLQGSDQGEAEAAANAVVDAANAAAAWASDQSSHEVSVINLMGVSRASGIDGPFVVEARLSVAGGAHLSELCAALPRVHDAINEVLADRVNDLVRTHTAITEDSFAAYGEKLRTRLNGAIAAGAVSQVQLVALNARDAHEEGCSDAKPGQSGKPG